ncbi:hypothetical protein [Serratia symbiotica]
MHVDQDQLTDDPAQVVFRPNDFFNALNWLKIF